MKRIILFFIFLFFYLNIFSQRVEIHGQFRGVWITTVKRLDFPSRNNLNADELKLEITNIIDSCKALGMNAIVFQIRPAADAFYKSDYEPWSEWLTGKQGRAPSPYFDPMEFMIEETHKRKMQFHAWINPFRAVATFSKAHVVSNHISKTKSNWFFNYGVNKYFDPGIPEVRNYIALIISDIVRRYDIDAIHFDDYFYPYPIKNSQNQIIDIPDKDTYKKYGNGFSNIKDWRRDNINKFVKQISDSINNISPWVRFGISPPGVWRNKGYDADGSATLGLAAYDWLFADVLLWIKNDWIDYVTPQLYWHIGHKRANFTILLDWWVKHNYNTDLYIGLNIHTIDKTGKDRHWGNPNEIPQQIKLIESYAKVKGFILFRYKSLSPNPLGIKDALRKKYYKDTTQVVLITKKQIPDLDTFKVVPKINNLVIPKPSKPKNIYKYRIANEISITWESNKFEEKIAYYNIYRFEKNKIEELDSTNLFLRSYKDYFRFKRNKNIVLFGKKYTFIITAINQYGKESDASDAISFRL
ncbi:MAG: family 10 glycosylhydrolase [Bacteroidota bacterium]|nr:family 10 glycosylhydrolase [Bacteroidota bacterium]